MIDGAHQSQLAPEDNKFHKGNGEDLKHYWLTPPALYAELDRQYAFDFDPCPFPRPEGFDGLTCDWGKSSYVNPPFGSILHQGPADKKPKKKGMTAWVRKALAEQAKGKRVVMVYPLDKWVLMLLAAGAEVRNLKDVRWLATEDGSAGKGTGRHMPASCSNRLHHVNRESAAKEFEMNLIQTATKDCPREDCSVTLSPATSTCMAWTPTYNKAGERIDSGDPNYGTQQLRCGACGEMWLATTKGGKTELKNLTTTSR